MSRGTWIKLTLQNGHPVYLNMELAQELYKSGDATIIQFGVDHYEAIRETPEQIFLALNKDAIYPWASLPGAVFVPPDTIPL